MVKITYKKSATITVTHKYGCLVTSGKSTFLTGTNSALIINNAETLQLKPTCLLYNSQNFVQIHKTYEEVFDTSRI